MLHITSLMDGLEIFKALGSDVRIEILNILLENNNMSMNELASRLKITNGALTSHIKKLESCGLITTSSESAGHGNQKICSVHLDKILIDLEKEEEFSNVYNTELKVGHYSSYNICPTCGQKIPNVTKPDTTQQEKESIAKKLLEANYPIDEIIKITDLSKEEVEKIIKK